MNRQHFFACLWLIGSLSTAPPAHAQDGFKQVQNSASPDGHYALAYGPHSLAPTRFGDSVEIPAEDEDFDQKLWEQAEKWEGDTRKVVTDYLMDARSHRLLLSIPNFSYLRGNHHEMEIGWAIDGSKALAIDIRRYGWSGIAWIEPRTGTITDIGRELDDAFRKMLARREGKTYTRQAARYCIDFRDPIILPHGQIILGVASASIPKSDAPGFDYCLKFQVVKHAGHPRVVLLSAQRGADWEYDQPVNDLESDLTTSVNELRQMLHGKARIAFDYEQAEWKKQIAALPTAPERNYLTRKRIQELDLRGKFL